MYNAEIERALLSGCNNPDCDKLIWLAKDGRKYYIREIEDGHLMNCILIIQRHNFKWRAQFYACLVAEAKRRKLL